MTDVVTEAAGQPEGAQAGAGAGQGASVTGAMAAGLQPARPQLIRAMSEQLLLNQIRQLGLFSRADLARLSGLPSWAGASPQAPTWRGRG
jgi:hypothetical protein